LSAPAYVALVKWSVPLPIAAAVAGASLGIALSVALRDDDEPDRRVGTPDAHLELAFTREGYTEDEHDDDVRVVDVDGVERNVVSDAAHPAWSPSGEQIAFERKVDTDLSPGRQDEIWVANADGSGERRLTFHSAADHDAAWSPDGRRILFVRNASVSVVSADGSGLTRLFSGSLVDDAAWSPDGRRIAFGRDGEIWVMNADGSGQTRLTRNAGLTEMEDGEPDWSPDGRWIAFERFAVIGCMCQNGIWMMDADGRNARQVTEGDDSDPKWRPVSRAKT
jgi:Tol biopolymer transport system component